MLLPAKSATHSRCRTAPASDGRANQACVEFLANLLKVPRSSVTIASGQTSSRKVIRVAGLGVEGGRKGLFYEAGEGAPAPRPRGIQLPFSNARTRVAPASNVPSWPPT